MKMTCVVSLILCGGCVRPDASTVLRDDLAVLRGDLARHYTNLAAHVSLAKFHHSAGRRLLAFGIMEVASVWFPKEEFIRAWLVAFHDVPPHAAATLYERAFAPEHVVLPSFCDNIGRIAYVAKARDPARNIGLYRRAVALKPHDYRCVHQLADAVGEENKAEGDRILEEFHTKHPNAICTRVDRISVQMRREEAGGPSGDARKLVEAALKQHPDIAGFHYNAGVIAMRAGDHATAKRHFLMVGKHERDLPSLHYQIAEYFLRRSEPALALEFFLNAFFLNPFFRGGLLPSYHHDVRRKVNRVAEGMCRKRWLMLPFPEVDSPAADPLILYCTVPDEAAKQSPRFRDFAIRAMGHDDERLAAHAALLLANRNQVDDATLSRLLADSNLRRRGLALYVAVARRGDRALPMIKELFLGNDLEWFRAMAIRALGVHSGPAAKSLLTGHLATERNSHLRSMIQARLARQAESPNERRRP